MFRFTFDFLLLFYLLFDTIVTAAAKPAGADVSAEKLLLLPNAGYIVPKTAVAVVVVVDGFFS
jgi:hypothetical protein